MSSSTPRIHPMKTRRSKASSTASTAMNQGGSPDIEDLVNEMKRSRKTSIEVKATPGESSSVKKAQKTAALVKAAEERDCAS